MISQDTELSLLDWQPLQDTASSNTWVKNFLQGDFQSCALAHSSFFTFDASENLPRLSSSAATASALERLSLGAALLSAFTQVNWTGPALSLDLLKIFGSECATTEDAVHEACILQLSMPSEPAYHLTKRPALLYMARLAFGIETGDTDVCDWEQSPSIAVWRLRTWLVHLRILDQPVQLDEASLIPPVEDFRDVDLYPELQSEQDQHRQSRLQDIIASCTLLVGHYHRLLASYVPAAERQASLTFLEAAKEAGLEYELTGRMGKRTKWQKDDKAQLVVLARSRERSSWMPKGAQQSSETENTEHLTHGGVKDHDEQPQALLLNDDTLLEKTVFTSLGASDNQPTSERPALSSIDLNHQPPLHPLDQALLLSLSFNHANDSPGHGLTTSQVAAFVARTLDHASENWSVYSMSLLLRSRLEASRSRTVERGVLQMQSLIDQLKLEAAAAPYHETGANVQERLRYFHDLALPPTWELERELATRYLGIGVVKSAQEIFERLEMWEEVVKCYASTDKNVQAIDLVKELLQGERQESAQTMTLRAGKMTGYMSKSRQAKLWCTLGDLERDTKHYYKAWEVSGESSARAMRALGGLHFGNEEWNDASKCLNKAVALHPIHSASWFMLGCADLKREDWAGAETAFSRCVALDEEDAESWTNLASVELRMVELDAKAPQEQPAPLADDEEEAPAADLVPASSNRTRTAFQCLKQAVKYKRDGWRIWENFMVVAIDLGEFSEACRALRTLIELRAEAVGDAAVDLAVLDRLVNAVVQDTAADVNSGAEHQARGLAGRVTALFDEVMLPRFSNNARIFKAHAKLARWKGDVKGSLEDYIKAYRCSVAQFSNIETNKKAFQEGAQEVQELVDLLRNSEDELPDWRFTCRSLLRTFIGRTKSSFEDEPEHQRLREELAELKTS